MDLTEIASIQSIISKCVPVEAVKETLLAEISFARGALLAGVEAEKFNKLGSTAKERVAKDKTGNILLSYLAKRALVETSQSKLSEAPDDETIAEWIGSSQPNGPEVRVECKSFQSMFSLEPEMSEAVEARFSQMTDDISTLSKEADAVCSNPKAAEGTPGYHRQEGSWKDKINENATIKSIQQVADKGILTVDGVALINFTTRVEKDGCLENVCSGLRCLFRITVFGSIILQHSLLIPPRVYYTYYYINISLHDQMVSVSALARLQRTWRPFARTLPKQALESKLRKFCRQSLL